MPLSVFDEIKDRLPITDVLATYITLIPSGRAFKAKCPFHNERSASFSVSPDKGLYYCFGCGAKGDIFTFVQQFEGVDAKGALKILADRAGVPLTRSRLPRESTDVLYELLEKTTERYHDMLAASPAAKAYLVSRGISEETIEQFRIGYAPDAWRFIAQTCTTSGEAAVAERAGLIKKTEKGYYDRFRSRIMFPLTEASGRVVGFSGRRFPDDSDASAPKYLNSPETELFQKSRILFGFDKAKMAIRQHHFAVMVEGQFDCVLAHQAGFKNTVASSGTAVSDAAAVDATANLVALARLTPNLFLAFDGDAAGQKALTHAALVALGLGMNPKVVPLPAATDPAEYIAAHGAEGWKALLKESTHFLMYQLSRIDAAHISPHVLVRTLIENIFPFLARVSSPIEQRKYMETIAGELSLPVGDVTEEFARFKTRSPYPALNDESTSPPLIEHTAPTTAERLWILTALYPSDAHLKERSRLEALAFEDRHFIAPVIAPERETFLRALLAEEFGALTPDEKTRAIADIARTIEEHFYADVRLHYSRMLRDAERAGDDATVERCMTTLQALNRHRHEPS
ncbi:MAG TPA: DNA primase [Candidatus Paceibacterota bacterium]|nr:DNA primase [Candidatus Paceibacterota bacterium]